MIFRWSAAVALLAASANGFSTHSPLSISKPTANNAHKSRSSLYMGPPTDPSAPITETVGEGSRKYRETILI